MSTLFKNKQATRRYAKKVLVKWGLAENGWTFKFNSNKSSVGLCRSHRRRNGRYVVAKTVELSEWWMMKQGLSEEQIKDTVLHEVAHALDIEDRGTSDHSWRWKEWAVKVGANPRRTCDVFPKESTKYRWYLVCSHCNEKYGYHRKPKDKKRACSKCCNKHNGGYYHRDFKLLTEKGELHPDNQ